MMMARIRIDDATTLSPSGDTLFPAVGCQVSHDAEGNVNGYNIIVATKDNEELYVRMPAKDAQREAYLQVLNALREAHNPPVVTVEFQFTKVFRFVYLAKDGVTTKNGIAAYADSVRLIEDN